ncbi:uncharacterized protein CTRU02_202351 [Colletotrichum truncatum]|uniref:Uncharacterized protein n=1 Tax=Colletotrichum truncatum TaxID=5467 RepID=A0ACC3ZK23_COLTU|nr:uncharacterized protein CTRU02_01512 [Colletotrichum truncatum]KAF6799833.1 hypothetical protein CTRU02_01512 [Colletotrichum truncatum]
MVKPGKLLPPDPRPWTADPESRKARKNVEKENGGFDWGQAIALGFIGATVVFGIDKSLRKCEEKHEDEGKHDDRRRQRTRDSRSRVGWSNQSVAGSTRASTRGRGYDRDDRDYYYDDDRDYWDRSREEREAIRAARDYSREPARAPESISGLEPRGGRDYDRDYDREYARAADQFDRDYGYGRRYDDHRRSRSNPASRSREYSNW